MNLKTPEECSAIDKRVAEAMSWIGNGWEWKDADGKYMAGQAWQHDFPFRPSTEIDSAWRGIEWLKQTRGHLEIGNKDNEWWVNLPITPDTNPCSWKIYGWGDTICMAICNAVLAVAEEDKNAEN